MTTKRTRTKKPRTAEAPAASVPAPGASGRVAPRKRTDAPKPARTSVSPARAEDGVETPDEERSACRRATPKPRRRRWPLAAAGTVLLAVALAVGGFSWDRWLRYDDAAEFPGEWQTHGTTAVVVIDDEVIRLSDDVAYAYALDTGAKTISYTFGNMEGAGRYRFSLDRSQLVITDGTGYSWASTLFDDIAWQFDQLVRAVQGQPAPEPPTGDGVTVLDRLSRNAEASPQLGEPVASEPQPETEPVPESKPEQVTEPEPTDPVGADSGSAEPTDPAGAAGSVGTEAPSEPEAPTTGGAEPETSDSPRGVFDVSDLPA